MKKNIFDKYKFFSKAIFCIVALLVLGSYVSAQTTGATLSLSPGSSSFNLGDTFSIKVVVEGSGEPMNAVEAKLSFDKDIIQVTSISKDGSAFSLWTVEPSFSNSEGTIEFGGGNSRPFSVKSNLVTIVFKSLKTGSAKVDFLSGSVLAADGKGTDILSQKVPGNYEIKPKPVASLPPTTGITTPPIPVVESATHPDPGIWYNSNKIKFTWDIPIGVLSVRTAFDQQPETIPTELEPPATTSKEIESEDGEWYFHLQYKNKDVWGPTVHRKVMIDTAIPSELKISVEPGLDATTLPSLKIESKDDLSGVRNYEITFNTNAPIVVKPEDLINNLYSVPDLPDGKYTVLLKVFDNAGNVKEETTDMELSTGRAAPKPATEEEVEEKSWFQKFKELFSIELIIIIAMAGVIVYLIRRIIKQKKLIARDKTIIKRGTMDIRSLIGKLFSAIIDEVEEQLMSLDHKPRLSENEQRIFDTIKEAIDVSEGLIDDQIKSVEKSIEE